MFGTMRWRFVLSHIVPLLIVVPLMGIALIYALETQVLLRTLARELTGQALLVTRLAQNQTDIWHDPIQAQAFAAEMGSSVEARVMLLDPQGLLLASSDPADAERIGQRLESVGWQAALAGETIVQTTYSRHMEHEIVDVFVPAALAGQQTRGIIRLSHRRMSFGEEFVQLRFVIVGVLAGGLLLGTVAGMILALNLGGPIEQANQAVDRIARGESLSLLPEQGPSETRELLRSVNVLVERLHNVERARRELLANLVHELGRPLGALRAAIETILRGAARELSVQQELLEGMKAEVDRMKRLLDDLAELRNQVLGTFELERRPTALSDWLAQTLVPWREEALASGLYWETTIPPDLPRVDVDPERLGQALGNLVSNAIKYTPEGGTVTVRAGLEARAFWVCVGDTGPGIPPEEQKRIFAPFYRSQTGRRFPQGMGLGLTIAQDLVTAHGGQLELQSSTGKGSQFTIRVPLILANN